MEPRLESLESKMMSVEDQLDEVNRAMWRQQQEIDQLRTQLREMSRQLRGVQEHDPEPSASEVPPHW
jgi:SlyX protein